MSNIVASAMSGVILVTAGVAYAQLPKSPVVPRQPVVKQPAPFTPPLTQPRPAMPRPTPSTSPTPVPWTLPPPRIVAQPSIISGPSGGVMPGVVATTPKVSVSAFITEVRPVPASPVLPAIVGTITYPARPAETTLDRTKPAFDMSGPGR
jgi:hypothetical protein